MQGQMYKRRAVHADAKPCWRTRAHAALATLEENERRFRAMFDQAAVGVAQSSLDHRWLLVNDRLVDILGYSREELLNHRFAEITHPDDVAADLEQYERLMAGEISSYTLEKRYIRKDGAIQWAELTISLVRNAQEQPEYTMAFISDINVRRKAENALRQSEERYRGVVETSGDGIVTTDMTGTVTFANQQMAKLLRLQSPDDIIGRPSLTFVAPNDLKMATEKWSGVFENGSVANAQVALLRHDGTSFPADASSSLMVDGGGHPTGMTAVIRDVTERTAYEAELLHMALHHTLTGLPNRSSLEKTLESTLAVPEGERGSSAVLILDLDRFKEINDTFGHILGDQVVIEVARRLRETVGPLEIVGQLSGEEFAVILPRADTRSATDLASRLLTLLDQPITLDGFTVRISWAIGIALSPEHATDASSLLRHAMIALSVAKEAKGGYAVYSVEQDKYSPACLALIADLAKAIDMDEIDVHYQPKVRLAAGGVDSMEALARWNHPQHGMIPPDEFIPLAERAGLIQRLTLRVLDQALQQTRLWHDAGLDLSVAVNLSAQSLHDLHFDAVIMDALERSGCAPEWLELEITEGAVMANPRRAMEVLDRLHVRGIRIAVDDFGTGYSSLSYLKMLPVDTIKIDQSFVRKMANDANDITIVRSIIDLGHNLGMQVVAEGVEDGEALHSLRAMGCDHAQGHHLSKPLPAGEATAWLTSADRARNPRDDRRKTVLIVDDDLTYLKLLRVLLSSEGYYVVTVASSQDAVAALEHTRADMILVGLHLAGTDGLELAHQLRTDPALRETVIVGMSTNATVEDFARARTVGCNACVLKPHATQEITRLVSRYLAA